MAVSIEEPQLFRLTAKQYEKMAEIGILPEHGVELIDGLVVEMSAQGDRHVVAVRRLNEAFVLASHGRYAVDPQSTAEITDYDEPDPDLVISRNRSSLERAKTKDIVLIVEVANTSLKKDLEFKRGRYAKAGIREYWVVDLVHDFFHIFRHPLRDGTYIEQFTLSAGEIVQPVAYDDVLIDSANILGLDRP